MTPVPPDACLQIVVGDAQRVASVDVGAGDPAEKARRDLDVEEGRRS